MTKEQLKNLRLEDFQAPNQVLCYGAGLMGRLLVDRYRNFGVHIVGFIDKNKQGSVETESGALPVYSIDTAVNTFGENVKIVVTIANAAYFPNIVADLVAAGVAEERIFDWSFANWITVPSGKCYCDRLYGRTILLSGALAQCCFWGDGHVFNVETLDANVPSEETVNNYVEKLRHYHEKGLQGEVPAYCLGCPHLVGRPIEKELQLKRVVFSATAHCNAECIYCTAVLETEIEKLPFDTAGYGELFLAVLQCLDANGLLAPHAKIDMAGGEISVSPARKKLTDFALRHPQYHYRFLTNCAVYSEDIAQVLAQDPESEVMCDLDAGTPQTYLLMKGFQYFDQVTASLRQYARCGRVLLKYIVMPGFNTSREDYFGTVKLLKELGLTRLILSQDHLHTMDLYTERRSLFEVARLKKLLADNSIEGTLFQDSFSARQAKLVDRFYKQMPGEEAFV